MTVDDVRAIVSLIERERGTAAGFEVCIGGFERRPDAEREREYIRSLAEAGATWWNEWVPPGDLARTREAISQGPLQFD